MLAWIAGCFFAADLILWHHSIAAVGAGLATVLANVQVVLVPIAAWLLLSEEPSGRVAAAVPVVLIGVVLISGVVGAGAYGEQPGSRRLLRAADRRRVRGLPADAPGRLVATCAARAGRSSTRRSPARSRSCWSAGCSTISSCGPAWEAFAWLVTLALTSQVLGWLLIAAALPRAPAAISSVVLTLQPVAAVLLAIVLLDEDPSAGAARGSRRRRLRDRARDGARAFCVNLT